MLPTALVAKFIKGKLDQDIIMNNSAVLHIKGMKCDIPEKGFLKLFANCLYILRVDPPLDFFLQAQTKETNTVAQ